MNIKKIGLSVIASTMVFNSILPIVNAQTTNNIAVIAEVQQTEEARLIAISERIDNLANLESASDDVTTLFSDIENVSWSTAFELYNSVESVIESVSALDADLTAGTNFNLTNYADWGKNLTTIQTNINTAIEEERASIIEELVDLGYSESEIENMTSSELKEFTDEKLEELGLEKEEVEEEDSNSNFFEDYLAQLEDAEAKLQALSDLASAYNNIRETIADVENVDDVIALADLVEDLETIINSAEVLGLDEQDLANIAEIIALDELGYETREELIGALEELANEIETEMETLVGELSDTLVELGIEERLEELYQDITQIDFETMYEKVEELVASLGNIDSLEDLLNLDFEEILNSLKDIIIGENEEATEEIITDLEVFEVEGLKVIYAVERNANTVEEVIAANFKNESYTYEVYSKDDVKLEGEDLIGTYSKIKIYKDLEEVDSYVFCVSGDVTGDGDIGFTDIVYMINHYRNLQLLEGLNFTAGCCGFDELGFVSVVTAINVYRGLI